MGLHACSRMRSSNINEPGTDTIRARIRRSELVIFSNKLTIIKIIIIIIINNYHLITCLLFFFLVCEDYCLRSKDLHCH